MPLPIEAFTITGGCNCRSIRYRINVPPFSDRPATVYCSPGASLPPDAKIPFIAIVHCNDCRRASGALLPMALVTETSRGQLSFSFGPWQPALNLWSLMLAQLQQGTTLGHYRSSEGRNRWFCSMCGTMLFYTISEDSIPSEWGWPKMLDIWLGSVDREILEKDWMKPERMLWCEKGIPWIKDLARNGAGGVPEHPLTKIDKYVGYNIEDDLRELEGGREDGKGL